MNIFQCNLIGSLLLLEFKWMRYGKIKISVLFFLHLKGNSKVSAQLDLIKLMQPEVQVVVNLPKFSKGEKSENLTVDKSL